MARARQEGSSPEPVEGLARDGPRPFPLSRLVPSAVSCGLCEPGLPAAPAAPALLPAAYLCAPTALPAVTAALGAPRWPGGPRSRPRGPRPDETRGGAATPPLTLEGPVQSHHGTAAITQGPRGPGDGAQLGACTRLADVGDLGGRTLPPPDALASAGVVVCTM
ncbi:bcl-2-binding component 3 isoform X2 [Sturnira hondurensis]|uniref:bcl-2-binding component 3 isoform X2 n=1 Tax=Sturnira hondurensis TaxID=192404 RepID=UPI00187A12E1|nr:bcl-2-binding component 3 isoform X2 [Sturnira hondurensis]